MNDKAQLRREKVEKIIRSSVYANGYARSSKDWYAIVCDAWDDDLSNPPCNHVIRDVMNHMVFRGYGETYTYKAGWYSCQYYKFGDGETVAKELKTQSAAGDEINGNSINADVVRYYEPIMDGICPLCGHFLDRSETQVDDDLFEVVDICNNCDWRGETYYD